MVASSVLSICNCPFVPHKIAFRDHSLEIVNYHNPCVCVRVCARNHTRRHWNTFGHASHAHYCERMLHLISKLFISYMTKVMVINVHNERTAAALVVQSAHTRAYSQFHTLFVGLLFCRLYCVWCAETKRRRRVWGWRASRTSYFPQAPCCLVAYYLRAY